MSNDDFRISRRGLKPGAKALNRKVASATHVDKDSSNDYKKLRRLHQDVAHMPLTLDNVPVPEYLNKKDKNTFRAFCSRVIDLDMSEIGDAMFLAMAAELYVAYHNMSKQLDEEGLMIEKVSGKGVVTTVVNPLFNLRLQLYAKLSSSYSLFGMNPRDRRKVLPMVSEQQSDAGEDDWDDFLN